MEFEYEKINLNKNDLKGIFFQIVLNASFLDILYEEILLYHSAEKMEEYKTKLAQGKSIFGKLFNKVKF